MNINFSAKLLHRVSIKGHRPWIFFNFCALLRFDPSSQRMQALTGQIRGHIRMNKLPYIRRVGVIGDVHAEAEVLEAVIQFLNNQGAETLLCMGDLTDGFGNLERCFELLEQNHVQTVLGNHDRWCIEGELRNLPECQNFEDLSPYAQQFLKQLPITRAFETPRGRVLMCHGIGQNDMGKIPPGDRPVPFSARVELQQATHNGYYAYLINGHSHCRMLRTVGEVTIINAGTIKREHQPGFLMMDFETGLGQAYDLDVSPHTLSSTTRPSIKMTRAESLHLPQTAIAAS